MHQWWIENWKKIPQNAKVLKLSIETNPIHSERFLHSHQCKHYIISHTQLQNQHNFFFFLLLFWGVIDLSYTTFELVPRYCCLFRETNDCLLDKKCHHFILISAMWQQGGHWTLQRLFPALQGNAPRSTAHVVFFSILHCFLLHNGYWTVAQ